KAGVNRFRSISMTTLIAIVSIIPLALGIGDDGEIMQGLSLVNVGGLTASTVLTLLLLPVYYSIMTGKSDKIAEPED
ncbi:MAG: efflux RND transporter permease subunit, partial [Lacrimispora sphenoides]